MNITLQYFDGCPNWKIADERLAVLAAERPDLGIRHQNVETGEDAERVGFHGSPTILIDGMDPFAHADASVGLACRIYETPQGPAGAPTLEQLRQAVAHS
ncbi:thioredoxin family protein [Demequina sp. TTPB684]|uniref:thioredoxin family protein n=1 Tax=unclassified Demequina TaxID=2620311 RepID=UPI001CF4B85C|nr:MULTISPECIES: thioredoxin family protein [unclassified Demequina]MCB2412423.1 thioredoxin family protein [Demequina sp. TTPB684]UPU87421.1 thioredoxin family protein [Demequina sp. TMPB413]